MQFWKSSNECKTVGVLLFDSFSNLCLANAIEPLRAANSLAQKQLYRWEFLSPDGAVTHSSSGMPVQAQYALPDHSGADYLIIMPSYGFEGFGTAALLRGLRAAAKRYAKLIAMDTGSWLLAEAGLLDGRRATIHWDEFDRFAERFPNTDVLPDRIVSDGNILSCGGASTAYEVALDLIKSDHGPMLSLEVASLFMQQKPSTPAAPQSVIDRTIYDMRRNIEQPLTISQIAARLGLSQKKLELECQRKLKATPQKIYRGIRLREARRLITSTDFPIAEIALRCGYADASAMTRAFKQEFSATPSEIRASAG